MKVVLFCGGQGLRIREYSDSVPKPMVPIGDRPILWHLMKYYAHWGHTEFILCLGHLGNVVRRYFLHYPQLSAMASNGGGRINGNGNHRYGTDVNDWSIQFVDTGSQASVGQRLQAVRELLGDDDVFLANYSDNLADIPLPLLVEHNRRTNAVATFVTAKPSQSFHVIDTEADQTTVKSIRAVRDCDVWVNGGFFVLRKQIFDFMRPEDDLVGEPFERLIRASRLNTVRYNGFWAAMDTFKEKLWLNEMYHHGNAPWEVWKPAARASVKKASGTDAQQAAHIA